jgi:fumarate reductase (CoM/CoB) subunit A
METDVLIVGGGAAGAMAAIKSIEEGSRALVVTKGPFPSGNTSIALAGYGAAFGHADPRDNPGVHFEDALKAGQGLCNQNLVRTWVTKIVEITSEMDDWGIDLVKEGNKFAQRPWEGHTYPRMVHQNLTTGRAVVKCLAAKSKEMGVPVLANTIIGGLLKEGEEVVGAWGLRYETGELVFVKANAVVLATGGMGNLFPMTDNVGTITGEGYAIAFKAGAELIQMEFCHFLPTISYPIEMRGKSVFMGKLRQLLNEGGARLYNCLGERFVKRDYPETGEKRRGGEELTRAIGLEICEGRGSPHGGVFLDLSDVPLEMQQTQFSKLWESAIQTGIDLSFQPIEIAPNPHDLVGGVKIDVTGRTTVPGLFAAGEAAGGAHGASRFGGSALADALAFGAISGTNAAHDAAQKKKGTPWDENQIHGIESRIGSLLAKRDGIEPSALGRRIQEIANQYLNVGRNEEGLKKALKELEQMERESLPRLTVSGKDLKEIASNLRKAIEVDGQLDLAKIIATAALLRKESRGGYFGGHYRTDYPNRDDKNWLKNIVIKNQNGFLSSHTELPITEKG